MTTIDVTEVKPGEWAQEHKPLSLVGMPNLDGSVTNLTLPQVSKMQDLRGFRECRIHCDKPLYEANVPMYVIAYLERLFAKGIRPLNLQTDIAFASVRPTIGNESLVIYTKPEQPAGRGDENLRNQTWINTSMFAHLDARYDLIR
jgi:hypothetical protein